jgi:hypothetical protein
MQQQQTLYGVWCVVYGGVTGRREDWALRDNVLHTFTTPEAAAAEASRLAAVPRYNRTAEFAYTARELTAADIERALREFLHSELQNAAADLEAAVGARQMRSAMTDHLADRSHYYFPSVQREQRHKLIEELVRRYF